MNNKRKRGRPTEAPLTERVHARVTKAEHARFIALGGSEWLRKQLAAAQDQGEVQRLREALDGAARSLKTISKLAGRDEYMQEMDEVRSYARNRAEVAFAALSASHGQEA